MKIFVDSSAWLARLIKKDINNRLVKQQYQDYKKLRGLFFTNDYVLAEVYTRLIYDVHLKSAWQFHRWIKSAVDKHQLSLLEVDPFVREQAWRELRKYSDYKLSFTDATIIANFKDYNLDEIFTFDKHLRDINLPTNIG